jgi:hypothetical protein
VLRHAVVVGANVGGSGLEPLRYAEQDAQRFADLLVELGGFDPVYVTVLYAPTEPELKAALHSHADTAASFDDDLFLFYYSGHADARGLRVGSDTYPFEALRGDIRAMQSEVKLGVLDACRSGTITRLKGAQLSQPFLYNDRLAAEGEAWITAASADETAQESDALRGSFFTHYLISGMRGAADSGDGTVSLQEAYSYAYDRVVDHTGGTDAGTQHPNFDYRIQGQGDLTLTTVTQGRATATLPPELAGQVIVLRLPDRTPVAEVAKQAGTPVTLALAPGNYKLRTLQGKELREAEVMLADGARVTVTQFSSIAADTSAVKGELLFRDPVEAARKLAVEHQGLWDRAVNPQDLRHSPLVAGGISVLVPGGGQFYNRQWAKGALYLTGTFLLFGGSVFVPDNQFFTGSVTGADPLALGAAMVYSSAIADASWNANRFEDRRPRGGGTIATSAAWDPSVGVTSPYVAGITAEWIVRPNIAIGVDRLGWTRSDATESRWNFGSRVAFSIEGEKWRPEIFVAAGGRVIQKGAPSEGLGGVSARSADESGDLVIDDSDTWMASAKATNAESGESTARLVGVIGAGGTLRYYVSPRFFLETEMRLEAEDARPVFLWGGGVGVHLGR